MMPTRNYKNGGSSAKKVREDFLNEEMRKAGKNKSGGTGFKMSQQKRIKNRKNR